MGELFLFVRLFTRKWIISTVLVLIGMAVMIRLGIWQLDRLDQRRDFNARVSEQIKSPTLELSTDNTNQDLASMEYRAVVVRGRYDFSNQVALRNQSWNDQYGVHLITPLMIIGSDLVVMVDRGWIPATDIESENWVKYDEPGEVEVKGTIRLSQKKPDFGRISDPVQDSEEKLVLWNLINVEQMQTQMPFKLLPIYISKSPGDVSSDPPFQSELNLDLSEGPHFGYAIQWFTFSLILAIIYMVSVRRAEKKKISVDENDATESQVVKPILRDQKIH